MSKKILSLVSSWILSTILSTSLYAGGLIQYEIGTPDMGLASAGWAARAEDAGTAFTNPAGMTRLKTPQFLFGVQPLYMNIKFDPNSKTTVSGTDGNASTWFPGGGGYLVIPLNESLSIGAAATGYFGSAIDYGSQWVGRYYINRSTSLGFCFIPGAAYRLSEHLSVGLSANIMYSILRSHTQVNNSLDGLPDGRVRVTGQNWAVGAVLGLLYEFDEYSRIGLQYVSEVKQRYNMTPTFLNLGPTLIQALTESGVINSTVTLYSNVPNWVTLSAYSQFHPSFALMGNLGWQQWSQFGRATIELDAPDSPTLSALLPFLDTWHAALGLQYFINNCSKASLGVAVDSSMLKTKNRTPSFPVGQQWRFGAGYQYDWSESLTLTTAYEYLTSGNLKLYQSRGPLVGTLAGKYRNLSIHYVSLGLIWNF